MAVYKKATIIAEVTLLLPLLVLLLLRLYDIAVPLFYLETPLLLIFTILLFKFIYYDKVVYSAAEFCHDRIRVLNKKNLCWREIPYNDITNVTVEEISGFFYGSRKNDFKAKYICFFMTDYTNIPAVSYNNLFKQRNFFIIAYTDEAWKFFYYWYSKK